MKASELRIGNLVMDGHDIKKVNARMIDMLVKNEADFDPIQLTEEWLLKFGFSCMTKIGGNKIEFRVYTLGAFTYNTNHLWWYRDFHLIGVQLEYVHQIQNLYFTLTGQELTFKQEEE